MRGRWRDRAVGAIVLTIALCAGIADPDWLSDLRLKLFDQYQRAYPRAYAEMPVKIVDIDDESLRKIGQWPWSRQVMATLATRLQEAGAAVVAYDIVFAEPDRLSPSRLLAEHAGDPSWAALLRRVPDYDRTFADALSGGVSVTGYVLTGKGEAVPAAKAGIATIGDDPVAGMIDYPAAVSSLTALTSVASGDGALNSLTDRDGIIRRMPLLFRSGDRLVPGLTAESLRVAQGATSYTVKTEGQGTEAHIASVRIGDLTIPADADGAFRLRFTPYARERYVPAWRVLDGSADAKALNGSIALIGTSAAGLKDIRTTPLDRLSAGVEVHAQAIEQAMLGEHPSRPDWMHGAELVAMTVAGLLLLAIMQRSPAGWSAAFTLLAMTCAVGGSLLAYREKLLLIDPLSPSLVLLVLYLMQSLRSYLATEAERDRVRHAFSHYMSPAMVEKLAANPDSLKLGGETREMTILFCDIRGFTAISERYDAEALTRFINRFLTPMTDVILYHGGTIDKYMGDAIMAFWNAPLDDPQHAKRAMEASLAMMDALAKLNAERCTQADAEGEPFLPVEIGVGLNTGFCCVGNMGSAQRFDYSVLGDDVNLASRLEGQSKEYGVRIVVGPQTAAAGKGLALIEIDRLRVKGKAKAVTIHALLGDATLAADPRFQHFAGRLDDFLTLYRAARWDDADRALEASEKAVFPIDGEDLTKLLALYRERITRWRQAPPPNDWDGSWTATAK